MMGMTMATIETMEQPKSSVKYFKSFAGYSIPFEPEHDVAYTSTENLSAFYSGTYEEGKLIKFVKYLLQREITIPFTLTSREHPGTFIYFQAVDDLAQDDPVLGKRIRYQETEGLDLYFAGEVDDSGTGGVAYLFYKQPFFVDQYRYWPNGNLRERTLKRADGTVDSQKFDTNGDLINSEKAPSDVGC